MARTHTCGAIIDDAAGKLVFIDRNSDEEITWKYYLGWPSKTEINTAKKAGKRFVQLVIEIPEKTP